jgi:toxin ParE1/3/4
MTKPRWSLGAQRDLLAIGWFIGKDNPAAARRLIDLLRTKARLAARMPRAGRRVPEIGREDVRELIVRNYRLVYQLDADRRITVLRVVEGHRAFPVM